MYFEVHAEMNIFLLLTLITMSIFNFFKQNKIDNDPYWEFNQSKHYKPKLNTVDFLKLTEFDFAWLVLEPISIYINDSEGELSRCNVLSYGQKALYYWWYVDAQVTNGGFTQFYYNDYAKYVPTIIKSLQYIGDYKMAELINKSYDLYLKENKKIVDARKGGLEEFSNLYKEIKDFDELDDEYYNLNDETIKNIEKYIRNNPNEFCTNEEGKEFNFSFSGELKTYHSNKNINEITPFLDGKVNGTYRSFYENGNPKDEINYIHGEATGEVIEYFKNGNKKLTITKSISPRGFFHSKFYEDGSLKSTEIFISKHDRDGKWIQYFPNGQMKNETEFVNKKFLVQNSLERRWYTNSKRWYWFVYN